MVGEGILVGGRVGGLLQTSGVLGFIRTSRRCYLIASDWLWRRPRNLIYFRAEANDKGEVASIRAATDSILHSDILGK